MPSLTVITVAWNSAGTIADACRSVAAQRWPRVEHLVVDGASRDGTADVARSLIRPGGRVVSEPDRGIYDAMNKGLRLATGDAVGFLNADDVYADDGVLSLIAAAFADPAVDVVFGDLVYVDADDLTRVRRRYSSRRTSRAAFAAGLMPAHPTFWVRRRLLPRCGLFDLRLPTANDFEFTLRYLAVHRLRARYLPRVLVRMRLGGVSNRSLGNLVRQNLTHQRILRRHRIAPSYVLPVAKALVRAAERAG